MSYNLASKFNPKFKEIEEWLKKELSSVRTGRATPVVLDNIMAESYGVKVPIKQLASISIEDARTLRVTPFDLSQIKSIEKAIATSNLGLSSAVDERGLRVYFPELSADSRKTLAKVVSEKKEMAKISLRKLRDEIISEINENEKLKEITEDDKFRLKNDLQKMVDSANKTLDEISLRKEKEILG
jgi:ribosome recycling factor